MFDDSVPLWVTQTCISSNKAEAMTHSGADIDRGGWISLLIHLTRSRGVGSCTEGCYHDNTQHRLRDRHNNAGTVESNFSDRAVTISRTGRILTGNKGCNSNNISQTPAMMWHVCTVYFCGRLSTVNFMDNQKYSQRKMNYWVPYVFLHIGTKNSILLIYNIQNHFLNSRPLSSLKHNRTHLRLCFAQL